MEDEGSPKIALGADTQVLKNKPNACSILWIRKPEGTSGQRSNQIPRKHALGIGAHGYPC